MKFLVVPHTLPQKSNTLEIKEKRAFSECRFLVAAECNDLVQHLLD